MPKNKDRKITASAQIHPNAFVETDQIGEGTRVWSFTHIMNGALIGQGCNICEGCYIEAGSVIGNHVTIKNGVSVWDGVKIDEYVFVGPNVAFTNDLRPASKNDHWEKLKTHIKKHASIGANATILCPITVGAYAFIGAGAVVTKDVPDHALVYGNPAMIQGFVCSCRKKLEFDESQASCICGLKFQKDTETSVRPLS